ncbi:MAG: hypothetical protein ACI9VR_003638 [Cognaticolwellia sp.]|jgi:hypothetical protein
MNRVIFQQALQATARVACAAALVGCVRNPPNASAYDETGVVDSGTSDSGTSDSGPSDSGLDTGAADSEAQECLDELSEQVDTNPKNREIRDCCETVAVDWEFNNADGEVRGMCCELLDWDANNFPGCTPWGPPRPPSMGARLSAARKVRAVRAAALAGVA